jgi:hypothetical protein
MKRTIGSIPRPGPRVVVELAAVNGGLFLRQIRPTSHAAQGSLVRLVSMPSLAI